MAMDAVVVKPDPDAHPNPYECHFCLESWRKESREKTLAMCTNPKCPVVVHTACLAQWKLKLKNPDQCIACKSGMGPWESRPLLHPASESVDEKELYGRSPTAPLPNAPAPLLVMMHSSPVYTSCKAASAAVCAASFVPSSTT